MNSVPEGHNNPATRRATFSKFEAKTVQQFSYKQRVKRHYSGGKRVALECSVLEVPG